MKQEDLEEQKAWDEMLKKKIVDYLENVKDWKTVSEIATSLDKRNSISIQKVTVLLKQLIETGKIVKTTREHRSYYAISERANMN